MAPASHRLRNRHSEREFGPAAGGRRAAEGAAGVDGGELVVVPDEQQLSPRRRAAWSAERVEGEGAGEGCLVDDEQLPRPQLTTAAAPGGGRRRRGRCGARPCRPPRARRVGAALGEPVEDGKALLPAGPRWSRAAIWRCSRSAMARAADSSWAAVAEGARPMTEPRPWLVSHAARSARRVVVLPVPAGPTSTSTRRPEVAMAVDRGRPGPRRGGTGRGAPVPVPRWGAVAIRWATCSGTLGAPVVSVFASRSRSSASRSSGSAVGVFAGAGEHAGAVGAAELLRHRHRPGGSSGVLPASTAAATRSSSASRSAVLAIRSPRVARAASVSAFHGVHIDRRAITSPITACRASRRPVALGTCSARSGRSPSARRCARSARARRAMSSGLQPSGGSARCRQATIRSSERVRGLRRSGGAGRLLAEPEDLGAGGAAAVAGREVGDQLSRIAASTCAERVENSASSVSSMPSSLERRGAPFPADRQPHRTGRRVARWSASRSSYSSETATRRGAAPASPPTATPRPGPGPCWRSRRGCAGWGRRCGCPSGRTRPRSSPWWRPGRSPSHPGAGEQRPLLQERQGVRAPRPGAPPPPRLGRAGRRAPTARWRTSGR